MNAKTKRRKPDPEPDRGGAAVFQGSLYTVYWADGGPQDENKYAATYVFALDMREALEKVERTYPGFRVGSLFQNDKPWNKDHPQHARLLI